MHAGGNKLVTLSDVVRGTTPVVERRRTTSDLRLRIAAAVQTWLAWRRPPVVDARELHAQRFAEHRAHTAERPDSSWLWRANGF